MGVGYNTNHIHSPINYLKKKSKLHISLMCQSLPKHKHIKMHYTICANPSHVNSFSKGVSLSHS